MKQMLAPKNIMEKIVKILMILENVLPCVAGVLMGFGVISLTRWFMYIKESETKDHRLVIWFISGMTSLILGILLVIGLWRVL